MAKNCFKWWWVSCTAHMLQASFNTNISGTRAGGGGGQGPAAARPATGRSTLPPAASPARQVGWTTLHIIRVSVNGHRICCHHWGAAHLQAAPSAPHVPPEAADTASALQPPQEPQQQQQPGADPAEMQALTDQAGGWMLHTTVYVAFALAQPARCLGRC
jgi:hypothetical protein